MAEILGAETLQSLALPDGIDGNVVAEWRLREGRTYEAFVGSMAVALGVFNTRLTSNWGWLFSITDEPAVEYGDGGAVTSTPEITDLDDIGQVGGTLAGHMIGLKLYGDGAGGGWKYFQRTREAKVQSTLRTIIKRLEKRFELNLLTRLLTDSENGIGSGWDVPFVMSGGSNDFTPWEYGGQTFVGHDHFLGIDSTTKGFDDLLNNLAATITEHGHDTPLVALVSRTDVLAKSYHALPDFVEFVAPVVNVIDRGGATTGNQYYANGKPMVHEGGIIGYYHTVFGVIEIRSSARIPTGHAWMGKSYGNLHADNPLVVRTAEEGFGAQIVTETSDNKQFPIKRIAIVMEHGVGVGADRTNGANGLRVTGGVWVNPVLS